VTRHFSINLENASVLFATIDTVRCTFGIPAAKVQKIYGEVDDALCEDYRRQVQGQLVSIFVGVCASQTLVVADARFFLQGMHDCLSVSKATSSSRVLL
jgi:hypothetical protein